MKTNNHLKEFLISALHIQGEQISLDDFFYWFNKQREAVHVSLKQVKLSELQKWHFNKQGNLVHDSGKFYSIEGIRVETNWGPKSSWDQPIINQPEIGFLGIITKKINGVLHFLMQAKIEPGNINTVQLSPSLQATKSNYTKIHGGQTPLYLEYFNGQKNTEVILDQLQSEQGARFLHKRNRNIIVMVKDNEDIPVYNNFCWLTLGQLFQLMNYDNTVNMDTRTVLSGIPFGISNIEELLPEFNKIKNLEQFNFDLLLSLVDNKNSLHSIDDIISWFTGLKFKYELNVSKIALPEVNDWVVSDDEIYHKDKKYFSVIGIEVQIENREVSAWHQPLIKAAQEGIIAFIIKKINGVYHFLVQAKLESGNFDVLEMAPTVQCLTGNYRKGENEYDVPYLGAVLNAQKDQIKHDSYQSEEGGRFYFEQNHNMIIEVGDEFSNEVKDNYIWMTYSQIKKFIRYNNYLNIEARSLVALMGI
jgi:oxidase EvaA